MGGRDTDPNFKRRVTDRYPPWAVKVLITVVTVLMTTVIGWNVSAISNCEAKHNSQETRLSVMESEVKEMQDNMKEQRLIYRDIDKKLAELSVQIRGGK